jgi:hypothetical protein
MTRYFILSVVLVLLATPRTLASNNPFGETIGLAKTAGKGIPASPSKQDSNHGPAAKAPHMDELPHIHRFHKQRLEKLTVHHGKVWLLTQVLIVLCHFSILVIGYLHATH